jgi:hypothetical protein
MEGKIRMSKYFETVDFWVENLLDSTENYTVESNEKGKFVDITINVMRDDMGKIIGKNGRIITALRVLMSSIGKKDRKSVKIEVKEM